MTMRKDIPVYERFWEHRHVYRMMRWLRWQYEYKLQDGGYIAPWASNIPTWAESPTAGVVGTWDAEGDASRCLAYRSGAGRRFMAKERDYSYEALAEATNCDMRRLTRRAQHLPQDDPRTGIRTDGLRACRRDPSPRSSLPRSDGRGSPAHPYRPGKALDSGTRGILEAAQGGDDERPCAGDEVRAVLGRQVRDGCASRRDSRSTPLALTAHPPSMRLSGATTEPEPPHPILLACGR